MVVETHSDSLKPLTTSHRVVVLPLGYQIQELFCPDHPTDQFQNYNNRNGPA